MGRWGPHKLGHPMKHRVPPPPFHDKNTVNVKLAETAVLPFCISNEIKHSRYYNFSHLSVTISLRWPRGVIITHDPLSAVLLPYYCLVDWSPRRCRVFPVRQPVNQVSWSCTPFPTGTKLTTQVPSLQPPPKPPNSSPGAGRDPTLFCLMASHYSSNGLRFPRTSIYIGPLSPPVCARSEKYWFVLSSPLL